MFPPASDFMKSLYLFSLILSSHFIRSEPVELSQLNTNPHLYEMSTNKGIVFQKGVDMVLLRQLAKTAKSRKCIFGRIPFYRHILIFFILQGCQCLHFLLRSDVKVNHRCLD